MTKALLRIVSKEKKFNIVCDWLLSCVDAFCRFFIISESVLLSKKILKDIDNIILNDIIFT